MQKLTENHLWEIRIPVFVNEVLSLQYLLHNIYKQDTEWLGVFGN